MDLVPICTRGRTNTTTAVPEPSRECAETKWPTQLDRQQHRLVDWTRGWFRNRLFAVVAVCLLASLVTARSGHASTAQEVDPGPDDPDVARATRDDREVESRLRRDYLDVIAMLDGPARGIDPDCIARAAQFAVAVRDRALATTLVTAISDTPNAEGQPLALEPTVRDALARLQYTRNAPRVAELHRQSTTVAQTYFGVFADAAFSDAHDIWAALPPGSGSSWDLLDRYGLLAKAGRLHILKEYASSYMPTSPDLELEMAGTLAEALADAGRFDEALETLIACETRYARRYDYSRGRLGAVMTAAGRFDMALSVMHSIVDPGERGRLRLEVADALISAGRPDEGLSLIQGAAEEEQTEDDYPWWQPFRAEVMSIQLRLNRADDAWRTAMAFDDGEIRVDLLGEIARHARTTGDSSVLERAIDQLAAEATSVAKSIDADWQGEATAPSLDGWDDRSVMLYELLETLVSVGGAEQAAGVAGSLPPSSYRAVVQLMIANESRGGGFGALVERLEADAIQWARSAAGGDSPATADELYEVFAEIERGNDPRLLDAFLVAADVQELTQAGRRVRFHRSLASVPFDAALLQVTAEPDGHERYLMAMDLAQHCIDVGDRDRLGRILEMVEKESATVSTEMSPGSLVSRKHAATAVYCDIALLALKSNDRQLAREAIGRIHGPLTVYAVPRLHDVAVHLLVEDDTDLFDEFTRRVGDPSLDREHLWPAISGRYAADGHFLLAVRTADLIVDPGKKAATLFFIGLKATERERDSGEASTDGGAKRNRPQ